MTDLPQPEHFGASRPLAAAILISIAGSIPVFLTGSLGIQIRGDLGLTSGQFGLIIGASFATTSLSALVLSRQIDHLGWQRGLWTAAALSTTALVGISAFGESSGAVLLAFLVIAGIGQSFAAPASNLAIHDTIPHRRQALAYGVKQASIPASVMLAGLALPAIALSLGWRYAYAIMALFPIAAVAVTPRHRRVVKRPFRRRFTRPNAALVQLTVAGSLAATVLGSLIAFYVISAVDRGASESVAGLLLAGGSISVLGVRVGAGWFVDRTGSDGTIVMAWMLAIGSAGYGFIAFSDSSIALLFVGTMLTFGIGWAWPGLIQFAIVTRNPDEPAGATSFGQVGMALGTGIGPLAFGRAIEVVSYRTAWLVVGALALVASTLLFSLHGREKWKGAASTRRESRRLTTVSLDRSTVPQNDTYPPEEN